MPRRDAGLEREVELAQVATLAPVAQQRSDGRAIDDGAPGTLWLWPPAVPTVSASTAASATRGERRSRAASADAAGDGDRFVVQEHHATRLHWDLRLEHDGVAASWAIPNGIPEDPHENRLAVRTEDHPLEYLEFEGDIPKGDYGAGTMRIWDRGTYERDKFDDDKVEVTFHGERLRGRYGLFPLKTRKGEPPGKDWMIHRMDPAEDPTREPMPERLVPMLAKPARACRPTTTAGRSRSSGTASARWRTREPGRLRFESRNRNDITASYPELRALNRALSSHRAILDGEIVAFDEDGRPSFGRLQSRMHVTLRERGAAAREGRPVALPRLRPAVARRPLADGPALRASAASGCASSSCRARTGRRPTTTSATARRCSRPAAQSGLEGVVAKRLDSPYLPGRRSPCWLKLKNVQREDVVVGGWLAGEGKRRERIGALLVGVPEDGRLRYAGRVGTGFSDAELDRLAAVLEQRERLTVRRRAGAAARRGLRAADARRRGRVHRVDVGRHAAPPVLQGAARGGAAARRSSTPAAPVRDGVEVRVGERTLKVTNLDKVMYPAVGFTKRDVIEYYVAIAPAILPHLEARPLTRVRFPNGVDGQVLLREAVPVAPPRLGRDRAGAAVEEDRRLLRLQRPADARLAREPRRARAAHRAAPRRGAGGARR